MSRPTYDEVKQEIRDHGKTWCKGCVQDDGYSTFLPSVYEEKRKKGESKESLQDDYDSCHIFR